VTARLLFDTSVYITVLRDETFAREFRPRYLRDIPRTHFSSVVIQELLAGTRTPLHRRQAVALYICNDTQTAFPSLAKRRRMQEKQDCPSNSEAVDA